MIVRDFAFKNPGITAAVLFVDPSHENYNRWTEGAGVRLYNVAKLP
jgi:hypothetical protein